MTEASRNNTGVSSSAPVSAFESFVSKYFVRLLVGIAVGGGALAFLVPWLLYIAGITGEADTNLRLHILYVTGGIIAVLGLVETHHKNTTDRAKALSEQARQFNETIAKEREKIEADKAKNEQTHMRQVHAERRSRYIAAIEQLSNRENTTTRLGGVYALIGLIYEHRKNFDDPLGEIEILHADFGYPEDVAPFVRYMPPTDYDPSTYTRQENIDRFYALWEAYLREAKTRFEV